MSDSGTRFRGARVPVGTRVYAIGDIHGCAVQLRALHELIEQDAADAPPRRVAVYVGDYIDRGAEVRETVDLLIREPLSGFESVYLIGNHEAFLLQFLEDEGVALSWLMNGGDSTCQSYGVDPHAPPDRADRFTWLQKELTGCLPKRHLRFFRDLKFHHTEGDYAFVHAGIRPGIALEDQDPSDLIWMREPFLSWELDHDKVVVHGHTPTSDPVLQHNRIGIDTGACYGGRLTAVVLEDDDRRFLQI